MARFCGNCGSLLGDSTQFCGSCGKPVKPSATAQTPASPPHPAPPAFTPAAQNPPAFTPLAQPGSQPSPASAPPAQAASPAKSGALTKVIIAVVGVLCLGGLIAVAGTVYVFHKVHEKVKAVERQALGGDSPSDPGQQKPAGALSSLLSKATGNSEAGNDSGSTGDPCRFLSKDDVSRAAGVEIIRTEAKDTGCIYFAKGDPADMVSKHATAMAVGQGKANGSQVTPQQQQMMQQITGAFFKQQEANDKDLSKQAATGEVPILSLSFSTGNAELEMKLNRMAFNRIGGSAEDKGETTDQAGTGDLSNLGDDAYEMGGTGLMMRKGQTVVRMMFPYCPCDAKSLRPLLAEIAGKL